MAAEFKALELTGFQRDIWAAEARTPGNCQFNVLVHERLEGAVDRELLGACLARAVRAHDAFRLRFGEDGDGVPRVRRVPETPDAPLSWDHLDLSGEPDPSGAVRARCEQELSRPLDLRDGPLFRAAVLTEGPDAVHLVLTAHHIVTDAWALNALTLRILSDYRIRASRNALPASGEKDADPVGRDDSPSYWDSIREFGYRADDTDRDTGRENDRAFYRNYLAGTEPALFTRSGATRPGRGRHSFAVGEELVGRILDAGASPFPYLLSALAVCLARVHQADEVVIGVPFLNRRTEDERATVGQFANNLPLRIAVAEDLPLVDLADHVRKRIDELREHERLPFGDILREAPTQAAHDRRLFDVTASYLRFPRPPEIPGVRRTTTIMAPVHATDALSLMIQAFDDEPGLRVDLDYADDVFDGHLTAEALAGHIGELLRHGLDLRELPVSALPMLTEDEYEDVVRRRQGAPVPYPREKTLHQLFTEQAARTPGLTAVVDGVSGATLTFAELDRLSNQVARALRERGAGPGERVAILAERGPELLPGLLGILKAGAAYVPVDPGYPPARIRLLLEDCGAKLVLRGAQEVPELPTGAPVLRISELTHGSDRPLGPTAHADDLAYTIYTSGSTGRPKGVMVEHHAVGNRLMWMQRRYPIGPGDTLLQKTPISFDVSVWELLWWAVQGARVVLLPPGAEKDPAQIVRTVREHRVSVIHFVPSMLGPFLDLLEDDPEKADGVRSLRSVFCSGEALPPERATQFNRVFDGGDAPRLVNLYGPTEAAVDVTYFDCPPASEGPVTRVPIGRPVENTTLYVLDRHGRPQPVGVPGELHIGGVQVARGYLNRPELTAERFVKDPFAPGGRLYRTGDLARLLNDGTVEYLGRNDDQVKIRGNRVELGEVQNALVALDTIRDAVVVDHLPGGGRGPVLVAYCTADHELDPARLRSALGEALPAYMIPAHFERLDALPLTPNGKVDRKALPAPDTAASDAPDSGPRTTREAVLAGIWAQVLGVDRVGVHTDYFVIGGDSISMLRVRALAEKAGLRFSTDDFVRNPTVAALAECAEVTADTDTGTGTGTGPGATDGSAAPAPFALVTSVDRARLETYEDAYPLTRLQLGLLFHSREKQDSATYKDVFRYSLAMPWREPEFRAAFDRLVRRHPVLRSSFALGGYTEPLQIVQPSVEGGLSVEDLRDATAGEAEAAIEEHIASRRRYDYRFDRAPLHHFRAFVLPGTVELVLSFHHAILDGGSVANLVSELLRDYGHLLGMDLEPVPDTAPPSAALHVAQERAAIDAKEGRAYWQNLLSGAPQLHLESFRPHEAPGSDERVECDLHLPAELVETVRATARDRRVPVKSVLFAAHVLLLRALSGERDVTTGLVTHTRPDTEGAERTCGLFLNTLPVRVDAEQATWSDVVGHVLDREREAHPYRRVPLAVIQEDLGRSTLVDTLFNFIHFRQLGEVFRTPGITSRGFAVREETNFSLVVNAMVDPVDEGIRLRLDFSGQAFTPAQARLYTDTYLRILRRLAEDPDGAVEFGFLAPAPPPVRTGRPPVNVVRAFEDRARRTPEAQAVVADGLTWSYAELDRIATRIATGLLDSGVRPGERVGIAMGRTPATVAAILGTAKAGCSAMPLDTAYPVDRLRAMIEQGRPARVVVDEEHQDLLEPTVPLLPYGALAATDRTADLPEISEDDEVYLLFTSGSTGRPKGVSAPHRSLSNLVAWQNGIASTAEGARTVQYAPLSFDVSFQELYATLCGGGTLVVVTEELRRDMPGLLRLLDRERVERMHLPYVALQQLAEASVTLGLVPRSLRVLCSSGEQFRTTDEIRRFCASLGDAVIDNHYGPTETHAAAFHEMTGEPGAFPALPPVGQPIHGARLLLLDARMRPVPTGARGEIYIGGAGLADGYAGRPDLTEERFVPAPDGDGLLYRTGDVGMVLPDGNLVCLGRADRQVKIRGYRVEPAEIELVAAGAPSAGPDVITDIAVTARRDAAGDTALIAFLVGDAERADLDGLRRHLRAKLPDYMVPAHFVWLPAIPLTPNGKRDEAALRRIQPERPEPAGRVAPRDTHERVLAEMLADLLHVPEVGAHDNLFDLGATSITAMRLVVLLEERFGTAIPLSDFIVAPTVAELAGRLRSAGTTATGFDPLVAIRPEGTRPPLFFAHPMGGNVLCYVPFAKRLPPDQPFYAFQAAGADVGTEPVRGLEQLAADYIEAMRRVRPTGPYHLGGWSFGGFVAFEMARQLHAAGERVGSLILLDTTALNPGRRPWTDDEALLGWFFWELLWLQHGSATAGDLLPPGLDTLEEKFAFMTRLAIDEGVLPAGSGDAVVRRLFRVYEANWRSAFDYRPGVVDYDVLLVRARDPLPGVLLEMHTAIDSMHADETNGWRERTRGRLSVVDAEGDHLTIMEEPRVSDIVGTVLRAMDIRTSESGQS
ncbi:amino acid adenylation domain-containing protein [Streptomyces griseus]|uniref:Amino acid adenylation domain-containing protein n=1 Tax=Streptomyces stephensoniae TaxID=3375367 RepID=A0ABU2W9R5_9ACTN|nr:non-ribosomal peptide synthetase [Streptomyces griseus]MDT0494369.1 amino acid adenylation domain-containing protein [Streptomyces griseus]